MRNWIIALICAAVGIWLSVAECSGNWTLFESSKDKAEAQAIIDTTRVDNQIRLDREYRAGFREWISMNPHRNAIQPKSNTPWYFWLSLCLTAIALSIAVVVMIMNIRAKNRMMRPTMPVYHPKNIIGTDGRAYRLELIDDRQLERGL